MALKKLTEAQKVRRDEERMKNMEAGNMMNNVENTVKNEVTEEVENTMEEVMERTMNNNSDDFFKSENVGGAFIPLTNLEIEIKPYEVVGEGRYEFIIEDVGIDNQVSTSYGVKNKMWLQFHLDGEDEEHELKQKYNISPSYKSRFYEVYTALTGEIPRGSINLKRLMGIEGYCDIQHVPMENGDIFPRIVNIKVKINKSTAV